MKKIVIAIIFLSICILLANQIIEEHSTSDVDTTKSQEYSVSNDLNDSEKQAAKEILFRLETSNFEDIDQLRQSLKPIHCESYTYQRIYDVKNYASNHLKNTKVLSGIETIEKLASKDTEVFDFCNDNENYYLIYSDSQNYPFSFNLLDLVVKEVQAGSGKRPYSMAWIKSDGAVQIINNYEKAITEEFDELSFYFTCTDMFSSDLPSKVYVACFGSEGPEDTFGIIEVNFDLESYKYLVYCINPLEENAPLSESGLSQNDDIYSCYNENLELYYEGSISTEYRFGND